MWTDVIKRSFFFTEFYAYEIERLADGVILYSWQKSYGENKAHGNGSLFIEYNKIVDVINTIRAIPEKELKMGTDGSGYGEWSREFRYPINEDDVSKTITYKFKNTYYERSSPKIEIYSIAYDSKIKELLDIEKFKQHDKISISHGYDFEGYIQYVEPIFAELEDHIPSEMRDKVLKPLGKTKTEIEKYFESYQQTIREDKKRKNEPFIYWIKVRDDENHYSVNLNIFHKEKIDSSKTIKCSIKAMAMIRDYMHLWETEIKTIPYTKNNSTIKIEISADSKYEGYASARIHIQEQNDYFEMPISLGSTSCFRGLCSYSDAARINSRYINGVSGFFEDEYAVLKYYKGDDGKRLESTSSLFRFPKDKLPQFLNDLKKCKMMVRVRLQRIDINSEAFSFFSSSYDGHISSFKINSNTLFDSSLNMDVFKEDLEEEISKIISAVEEMVKLYQKQKSNVKHNKKINKLVWKCHYLYDADKTVFHLQWWYENDEAKILSQLFNKRHSILLSKEKIYKIQEYAFWWWRCTDHTEKTGFSDDEINFEISPDSNIDGYGTVSLQFNDSPSNSLSGYFSLSDGSNLPKDFCDFHYTASLRKIRKIENPEQDLPAEAYNKTKAPCDNLFYHVWNCKYEQLNEGSRSLFVIYKDDRDAFLSAAKEILNYVSNAENKICDLLSKEWKEKYRMKFFSIDFSTLTLFHNCPVNLQVDEDIPMNIVFYSHLSDLGNYFSVMGTRKTLIEQLSLLVEGLQDN